MYSILFVASKFAGFEPRWSQSVGEIAREGVQNTHHWSGRTEIATENRVAQLDHAMQCNAMMIMGAGVSLYAQISLTNECA